MQIVLLNGAKLETEINQNDLIVLYRVVFDGRATIIIAVSHHGKEGGLDLRRLDLEATLAPNPGEIVSESVYG